MAEWLPSNTQTAATQRLGEYKDSKIKDGKHAERLG